jgi:hypothetical protein
MSIRPAFFWVTTQRTAVIPYRRFGTNCRFHLQGSRNPRKTFMLYLIVGWLVKNEFQRTDIWGSHRAVAEYQAFWNMTAWSWVGWVVPDVSEKSNAFIYRVEQSKISHAPAPIAWPAHIRYNNSYTALLRPDVGNQSAKHHDSRIFSRTAMKTWKVALER